MSTSTPLVQITGLKTYFSVSGSGWLGKKRQVRAVDGVDLTIPRGGTVGLVGESGSGKTTVGRTLLRLVPATDGQVVYDGKFSVLTATSAELRPFRRRAQMIFQDPVSSLDPRMTVGNIIAEPLQVHFRMTRQERNRRVGELLERVGLAAGYINRYPHEFSGGQRQRIGIARALACQPEFIVCDEPVSALDVSIQAQILNLLKDLQKEMNLSYLFIAHNLAVVEHFVDTVAVMYLGRIVEVASKEQISAGKGGYESLQHPYTQALVSAVPQPVPGQSKDRIRLPGEVPSPIDPPTGCTFHPRCPLTRQLAQHKKPSDTCTINSQGENIRVLSRCVCETPPLRPAKEAPNHLHACHCRL